ncbi:MAG: hypothetical protein VX950_03470, partial [Pseudomonadota bacterium]|nr:hypothetical protein [Pseudomonadota bacterium]
PQAVTPSISTMARTTEPVFERHAPDRVPGLAETGLVNTRSINTRSVEPELPEHEDTGRRQYIGREDHNLIPCDLDSAPL